MRHDSCIFVFHHNVPGKANIEFYGKMFCFVFFRFDVEMECEKINETTGKEPPAKANSSFKIKTQLDASCNVHLIMHLTFIPPEQCVHCGCACVPACVFGALCSVLTDQEKLRLANNEKTIGNEAFRAQDYEEAVVYYSRSGFSGSSTVSPPTFT